MKKTVVPFLAALAILPAALFYQIVMHVKAPGTPDSVTPMAITLALDNLKAATGSYPLWQPWIFSGMPTVEAFSYLSGLYLPNILFGIMHIDPIYAGLIHLVFAGIGGFVLMKRLKLQDMAAFFTGAVFMLNPFMTAMLVYGHGSQLMTAAYMPWALWATLRLMDERGGLMDAGILALIVGLQLQRAHVQVAYYTWMLMVPLGVMLFVMALKARRPAFRQGTLFVIALAAGVAMAASIYLPSLDYLPFSARSGGNGQMSAYDYATMWSMHPVELLTFILPGAFGFGGVTYWGFMPFTDFPQYGGLIVLLFAIGGFVAGRKNPLVRFFAVAALLALFLSFGRHVRLVYDLFYYAAPLFSKFRVPSMALIMVFLCMAVLGGYGIQALLQKPLTEKSKVLKTGTLVIAILTILFLFFENDVELFLRTLIPPPSVELSDLSFLVDKTRWLLWKGSFFTSITLLAFASGFLWLAVRKMVAIKTAVLLIVTLAVVDILWIDARLVYPGEQSLRPSPLADHRALQKAMAPDDITGFLSLQEKPFRIYPAGRLFTENKFSIFGIESTGGYHPAKLKIYKDYLVKTGDLANLNVLRMLNVTYVLSPVPMNDPELTLVKSGVMQLISGPETVEVYRLTGVMPRAWFARSATALASDDESIAALMSQEQQAVPGTVFLSGQSWQGTRAFAEGTILSSERKSERLAFRIKAEGDAFLVVSEVYYPKRWMASIDGRAAETILVNGLIRGVRVPAGIHDVVFSYDRSRFEAGQHVSFAALLIVALMLAAGILMNKPNLPAEQKQS